jgi:sec-independent protein translocase protein TatA
MGNFGMGEMLFIGVFALLLFGPSRLPEISRSVGKAVREFKQVTNGMTQGVRSEWASLSDLRPPSATSSTPATPAPVPGSASPASPGEPERAS